MSIFRNVVKSSLITISTILMTTMLAVAVVATPVCAVNNLGSFAELENEFREVQGFTTVIVDLNGREYTHNGVLNTTYIEEYDCVEEIYSYRLLKGEEQVAEIVLNDINCTATEAPKGGLFMLAKPKAQNGYYSITFTLSTSDNTEMFLTGLTYSDIESIESEIVSSITSDDDFDITRLNFIDTEKQHTTSSNDSDLCWAAAAANLMQYTGWAAHLNMINSKGEIMDCDDIMELFIANFNNHGYDTSCGIGYLLNGVDGWSDYIFGYVKDASAGPKSTAARTIYDTQHAYDMVSKYNNFNTMEDNVQLMQDQLDKLNNGWGINLNLGWLGGDETTYYGAHAISLWGYVIDKDYAESDKRRYTALVVSDSDNTVTLNKDRRTAPNRLTVTWIEPYSGIADSWKEVYGRGVVISMVDLMPYSDAIPVETNSGATRNKLTTCDLTVSRLDFSDSSSDASDKNTKFTTGQDIYVSPVISNLSEVEFDGVIKCKVIVKDQGGNTVAAKTQDLEECSIIKHSYMLSQNYICAGKLNAGTYTVIVDVNSDRSIDEAFYYNNDAYESTITVIEDPARNVDMSASADGYTGDYGNVNITYDDDDNYLEKAGNKYRLEVSYFCDGEWTSWETANSLDESGYPQWLVNLAEAPEEAITEKNGTKAKFRLVVNDGDIKSTVCSNEINLTYSSCEIVTSGINPGIYTPLEQGSYKLNEGEYFAFKIKNNSTESGTDKYRAEIGLVVDGEYKTIYEKHNIEIAQGEESEIISASEWSKVKALYSTADAYARVYYESGGKTVYQERLLGNIRVSESPSTTVTISDDIEDDYDGEISLREAVKYAKQLGVKDVFLTDSVRENGIAVYSPVSVDSEITIHGSREELSDTIIDEESAECVTLYANLNSTGHAVEVTQAGNLTLDHVRVISKAYYTVGVGIIKNSGGQVTLSNCLISKVSGYGLREAMIYADGGIINIQNTSIVSNVAGYKMIEAANGGNVNMLNCFVSDNTGTDAIVCNNGGNVSIVYSTFLDNVVYSSAGASPDAVSCIRSESGSETNVIACIVMHKEQQYAVFTDIYGPVKVYGTMYSNAGSEIITDKYCRIGDIADAVEIDEDTELPVYRIDDTDKCFWQKMYTPLKETEGQIYINAEGKYIRYSVDGKNWIKTAVKPAFAATYYGLDIFGKTHNGYYGCYSPTGIIPGNVHGNETVDTADGKAAEIVLWLMLMLIATGAAHGIIKRHR